MTNTKSKQKRVIGLIALLIVIALVVALVFILKGRGSKAPEIDVNNPDFSYNTIYQIVTDRFVDGDPSNNPSGEIFDPANNRKYHGGDWQGICEKIEDGYLTNMGISAIWISSPVENIMSIDPSNGSASYHGYWARDFFRPNPAFGTMDDFKHLVDTAHAHGIKVIIDFAPNHTSTVEPYDLEYPEDGALFRDGELVGTFSADDKDIFHDEDSTNYSTYENSIYGMLYGLADLNHANPEIDTYLKDAIDKWLDFGIDGIRVDAVKHMEPGWQTNWVSSVYQKRNVFVFGEWFHNSHKNDPNMTNFANHSGMTLLDFRFANALRELVARGAFNMKDFYAVIEDTAARYDDVNDMVTFVDNHDISRIYSRTFNEAKVDIAHALLLTSRGVPIIYYGSEQYMEGAGDPDNREDMVSFNRESDSYRIIAALADLRKGAPSLAYGTTEAVHLDDKVIVFERVFGDDVTLVAVNLDDKKDAALTDLKTSLADGKYKDVLKDIKGVGDIKVTDGGTITELNLAPLSVGVWHAASESDAPLIGDIDPPIAIAGNTIAVSGVNFGSEEREVTVGGKPANVLSWHDRYIEVEVPEVEPGVCEVEVAFDTPVIATQTVRVLTDRQIPVRFIARDMETEGQGKVYLSGNVEELGNWDEDRLIGPFFYSTESIASYPDWFYNVSLPINREIEYKFVIVDEDGNVTWPEGDNHVIKTGEEAMTVDVER